MAATRKLQGEEKLFPACLHLKNFILLLNFCGLHFPKLAPSCPLNYTKIYLFPQLKTIKFRAPVSTFIFLTVARGYNGFSVCYFSFDPLPFLGPSAIFMN